jgi:hypothetical protein
MKLINHREVDRKNLGASLRWHDRVSVPKLGQNAIELSQALIMNDQLTPSFGIALNGNL